MNDKIQFRYDLSIHRAFSGLIIGALFVLVTNLITIVLRHGFGYGHLRGLIPLFDMDKEFGFAAIYSSSLILTNAVVLFLIAKSKLGDRQQYLHWLTLAATFLFLSIDELMQIHEKLEVVGLLLSNFLGGWPDGIPGFHRFAWILPYVIVFAFLLLWLLPFLKGLPRSLAFKFILSGLIYVGGAVGIETIGGILNETTGRSLAYDVVMTCEESLEISGMLLFFKFASGYL